MKNTTSVDTKTIELILVRLERLANDVQTIKKALFEKEPPYGSDEWWEWSDKKAMEEIKAGKGTVIHNKKELQTFLDSLKNHDTFLLKKSRERLRKITLKHSSKG